MMHGVVLLAVFLFTLLAALAVRARLPLVASLVMVAGAGWPATIYPTHDDLGRGAVLLIFAARAGRPAEAERAACGAAGARGRGPRRASRSSPRAPVPSPRRSSSTGRTGTSRRSEGPTVSVSYVWKANYSGISFPKKRTRVFTVRGPSRSVYWRATTLDSFVNDHWREEQLSVEPIQLADRQHESGCRVRPVDAPRLRDRRAQLEHGDGPRGGAPRHPPGEPERRRRLRERAGRRRQLLGRRRRASASAGPAEHAVHRLGVPAAAEAGAAGQVAGRRTRARSPTRAPISRSPEGDSFRRSARPRRHEWLADAFTDPAPQAPTSRSTGTPTPGGREPRGNPYAAAVALEAWFRSSGDFSYDESPHQVREGTPPLVSFVRTTRAWVLPALRGRDGADA